MQVQVLRRNEHEAKEIATSSMGHEDVSGQRLGKLQSIQPPRVGAALSDSSSQPDCLTRPVEATLEPISLGLGYARVWKIGLFLELCW